MSGGFPEGAGRARRFRAVSAAALSAALLASVFALRPHLRSPSLVALGAEAGPPAAETSGAVADADSDDVQRLRVQLERQPRDARAWVIYARLQAEAGQFARAAQAYERALALSTRVAADAAVWCELADALGMAQGGRLAGRPREFIERALVLDPQHPHALEMAGSAEYEQGNYAQALRYWRPLLAALRPGSETRAELAAAIVRAGRLAAVTLPPAPQ